MQAWVTAAERAVTRHPRLARSIVCRVTARPNPVTRPNTETRA